MAAIRRGAASAALPRLNALKGQHTLAEGVDYARALCFLADGAGRSTFEARQSLLEELRLHPAHRPAQLLLQEVNELVRPCLLPPPEVQQQHPLFALLCDALLDSTMLSWPRLMSLYTATERLARGGAARDAGHIVECGTAGGGAAVMMAVVLAEFESPARHTGAAHAPPQRGVSAPPHYKRRVFALDTFAGMPAPSSEDVLVQPRTPAARDVTQQDSTASWGTGTCASPAAHVRQLAAAISVEDRLVVMPGLFQTSIPTQLLKHPEIQRDGIALLHLDADWYVSTRTALEQLVPVMRRGVRAPPIAEAAATSTVTTVASQPCPLRMVQVDDYHYWAGCRRAVDEYLAHDWSAPQSSSTTAAPTAPPPSVEDVDDNAVYFMVPRDMQPS